MVKEREWYKWFMRDKTWIEFILDNFKPGTATEVAKHIERCAREQNYRPHNFHKMAKVFQILPEHTPGMSKNRHKKQLFKNINGVYYLHK